MNNAPRSGTALKNHHPRNHAGFCYVFAGLLLLSSNLAYGGYRDDVGQLQLVDELGANTPYGSGVKVTAVDCCAGPNGDDYSIDPSYFEFTGKTVTNVSPIGTGFSDHATEVGRYFFGNNTSIAPGIIDIDAYENVDFAVNFLGVKSPSSTGPRPQPLISSSRIENSSYTYNTGSDALKSDAFRRLDWLTERDEFIQVVIVPNIFQPQRPIWASAYNIITVVEWMVGISAEQSR